MEWTPLFLVSQNQNQMLMPTVILEWRKYCLHFVPWMKGTVIGCEINDCMHTQSTHTIEGLSPWLEAKDHAPIVVCVASLLALRFFLNHFLIEFLCGCSPLFSVGIIRICTPPASLCYSCSTLFIWWTEDYVKAQQTLHCVDTARHARFFPIII